MRQSVDGVTQIVDRAPPGEFGRAGYSLKLYWGDALVWFMRVIAWVWVVKGLYNWGLIIGAFPRLWRFRRSARARCKARSPFSPRSIRSPPSACGSPRPGAACCGCCAPRSRSFRPALGVRGAISGPVGVGFDIVLVAVYFFLTWRAGQERG